ncbi:hypothetical protein HELRODRAFT_114306 [Helobdella robusta]|uniref:33 kDa inner dynein arm light chain, axonemal n=1 Tax=Helobdella robusta TaxID=6412 RepID=T1EG08_HELRO|nr:hypothetical protein HELRODRAFT_114306 [Helobdella robusta]ESN97245.1 hypothetical protein HELRODRAFT_114306 [Helobdella robusta]
MIPTYTTLVKYDNPRLATKNVDSKDAFHQQGQNRLPDLCTKPQTTHISTIDDTSHEATVEVLNSILPPIKFKDENNTLWMMAASSVPATRLEVINLQTELDNRLLQRQARETGICPVRRELYSQCFDEIIRQVTINCAERGLLLVRMRDELRMTIAAYQTLYESSIAFGMRKALQADQGKADLEKQIVDLESDKRDLERQVNELKVRIDQSEKKAIEQRSVDEKKHAEEIQFLKKTTQQLKMQLEGIVAAKK